MPDTSLNFRFVLFNGFSNMVLASALEPLRDVKIRSISAKLSWRITTMDGLPVKSSSGLSLTPDMRFSESGNNDIIIFISGYGVREHVSRQNLSLIRKATRNSSAVVGMDTAPWLLAEAGLLDSQEATIHWQELSAFEETFPRIEVSSARFVISHHIMTCGGASTALELILELIRMKFGPTAAHDASSMFVYDPDRQNRINRGPATLKHKGSQILLSAIDQMVDNIEHPLPLAQIHKHCSTSLRTLNRIFQTELGTTPGAYYQQIRLGRARDLATQTSLSINQIALRCGFASASSLSRAFSNAFKTPISQMRKKQ